ncbi:glycoside hydrolase family 32 protein [Halosimplex amylolyticum]|uniref:glycoside hydrolase family 32 protein n=1 Tax=Halosimplex amylolyticum TaxID=3396616 RepID=UPI003F563EDD
MSLDSPETRRRNLASDPYRPAYHFVAPSGWLNDPNGVIQFDGTYHLLYQYNPYEARHPIGLIRGGDRDPDEYRDRIHWGHATSEDLLHWTDETIALSPTPGTADEDSCYSGCAVADDGDLTFVYTGNLERDPETGDRVQRQLLATNPGGENATWAKDAANPVLEAPEGIDPRDFRDPFVWQDGDTWYGLVGAQTVDGEDNLTLFRSADLRDWTYLGSFMEGVDTGMEDVDSALECPGYLPFEDVDCLYASGMERGAQYFLGELQTDVPEFDIAARGTLAHGDYYAPQAFVDDAGRTVVFGWAWEARSSAAQAEAGWSGAMALPQRLSVEDGSLRIEPVEEVERLRGQHREFGPRDLDSGEPFVPSDVHGDRLELRATFRDWDDEPFGLTVYRPESDAGTGSESGARVVVDPDAAEVRIERDALSQTESATDDPVVAPFEQSTDEETTLRVFVDRSVLEVYCDRQTCLVGRVYPDSHDHDSVGVSGDGPVTLASLDCWTLDPVWPVAD